MNQFRLERCPQAAAKKAARLKHAFTVDVEDWYHCIPLERHIKDAPEHRLQYGLNTLLEMLDRYEVTGTFFWLGQAALEYRHLLQHVVDSGHEIGCHGWSHDFLYDMSRERFRNETQRAIGVLSDLTGKPIVSYRAAYFSITRASFWALDILAELGIKFDSSIFPVRHWRYGIPDFPKEPLYIQTEYGKIYEFPMTVRNLLAFNIPVSGGAYFRLYPYALTHWNFMALERQNHPVIFYLHPWELDPTHPRIPFEWKARLTHYFNLSSTHSKLERLLQSFSFTSLSGLLRDEQQSQAKI